MDEAQEILLNSLRTSGIFLDPKTLSIKDLTPDSLFSICAQFLHLIDGDSSPQFPTSLPSSMADRFKIFHEMASAIKASGYRGDLSFNQFMYPSDGDSYNLVRFLVEKLSESSESRRESDDYANNANLVCNEAEGDISRGSEQKDAVEVLLEDSNDPKGVLCVEGDNASQRENMFVAESGQKYASLSEQLSKLRHVVNNLQNQEKMLMEAKCLKALEVHKLDCECESLKLAVDMASDDQHTAEFLIEELDEQVESRRNKIKELKSQWNSTKQATEVNQINVKSGIQERVDPSKGIARETESIMSEIHKRELEHARLLEEIQKLPKIPPRKSYIQRITEITQNSWKQDADVDRILKETRELQLESNSIRERLDRTYVVVDEAVFREAKKDTMGRQIYRLLISIHDNFEQISTKILATDRARREAAEQEAKLAALSSRNLDINKLQIDLDSIRKENEFLEQKLHNN